MSRYDGGVYLSGDTSYVHFSQLYELTAIESIWMYGSGDGADRMESWLPFIDNTKATPEYVDETINNKIFQCKRDINYVGSSVAAPTEETFNISLNGQQLTIMSSIISGKVNIGEQFCYFSYDITNQLTNMTEKSSLSFELGGVFTALGVDNLQLYDFKVDVIRDGNIFKIQVARLVVGATFSGAQRTTSGCLRSD